MLRFTGIRRSGLCQQCLSRGCSDRRDQVRLAHRPDRTHKKLFFITLALYLTATAGDGAVLERREAHALFRFLTGAGIGGRYTAINSTIQELVPARYRGWTDLVINGSFWIGAALGAVSAIILLDPAAVGPTLAGGSLTSPAHASASWCS